MSQVHQWTLQNSGSRPQRSMYTVTLRTVALLAAGQEWLTSTYLTVVSTTHSITHSYSEICGQMAGYQKGSPDAFWTGQTGIDEIYVDGISITHGSPRQHVWTYAIGLQENFYYSSGSFICPCGATSKQQVPSFVGSDYYCESGCPSNFDHVTISSDDVLWDGKQCGVLETDCCTSADQPWFFKVLDTTTSGSIEIRLCQDGPTSNENILVSLYEVYVK